MKHRWILALPLLCAACLENDEEITVRPDGSLHVVVHAKGDAPDLAGGYPVPTGWPWAAVDADTRLWLAEIGPDTGGPRARASVEAGRAGELWKDDVTLATEATFRDAADWPERAAPADAPYADAYSRRSARLDVRRVGGRTVYAFTRTLHAPAHGAFDPSEGLLERLPEGVVKTLEAEEELSAAEWEDLTGAVRGAFAEAARAYARGAALPIFTEGDASLDPSRVEGLVDAAEGAVGALFQTPRLQAILAASKRDDESGPTFEALERDTRDALRRSLETSLADAGAPEPTRLAARERLEWLFTAVDHDTDLRDETFAFAVRMPGTIVGGNFQALEDGRATWSFEGKELVQGDVVLRVVSVLD